ncbi:LysR family transcriptional regulator [Amphibacillus sp. MSJ-3]|uniref:LysR family transcriptional regulator n=1 Tax=Amphibacillus sp. MSJ-3 TaxID=2841505 RepID=UPI001C0F2465|nr:LysR family transcriptional regulator [Amphibacillus sp. MSJ-3]MBU5594563.1 LysR family transcriptional regulator [Amphibacillus sp. MSJ-3]
MAQINSPDMLNYLNALLKHGNFTKAAKDLYISQPYLTQTIQKIEQELDVEIINRRITPLQLTEAGELYYQYLNSLEVKQDQFRRQMTRFNTVNQKIIRIGVLPSLGTYLLPLFLPDFIAKHPEITIEIHEALPKVSQERVIAGEIDFYLGQNPETAPPI